MSSVSLDCISNKLYGIRQITFSGWNSYSPIFEKLITKIKPEVIIEVGSWLGASAINMTTLALKWKYRIDLIAVDTFLGDYGIWNGDNRDFSPYDTIDGTDRIFNTFMQNVRYYGFEKNIIPLRMDSINAFKILNAKEIKADLIYIDGSHDYESVLSDFRNYKLLLKDNGILLGDDYNHEDVRRAAGVIFGTQNIHVEDGKFWYENNGQ